MERNVHLFQMLDISYHRRFLVHFVAVKLGLNLILNFKEEGGNFRPYPYVGEVLDTRDSKTLYNSTVSDQIWILLC